MEQKENITRTSHFLPEDMSWTCARPVVASCGQLTYRAITSTNTEIVHSSGKGRVWHGATGKYGPVCFPRQRSQRAHRSAFCKPTHLH